MLQGGEKRDAHRTLLTRSLSRSRSRSLRLSLSLSLTQSLSLALTLTLTLTRIKVAGLFKLDAETQRPKLKMYKDAAGRRKGDALLCFLKPESVALAVTLRDGYELRPGRPISVVP